MGSIMYVRFHVLAMNRYNLHTIELLFPENEKKSVNHKAQVLR